MCSTLYRYCHSAHNASTSFTRGGRSFSLLDDPGQHRGSCSCCWTLCVKGGGRSDGNYVREIDGRIISKLLSTMRHVVAQVTLYPIGASGGRPAQMLTRTATTTITTMMGRPTDGRWSQLSYIFQQQHSAVCTLASSTSRFTLVRHCYGWSEREREREKKDDEPTYLADHFTFWFWRRLFTSSDVSPSAPHHRQSNCYGRLLQNITAAHGAYYSIIMGRNHLTLFAALFDVFILLAMLY